MFYKIIGGLFVCVLAVGALFAGAMTYFNQPYPVVEDGHCKFIVEPWHYGFDEKNYMTTECGTYGDLEMGPAMSMDDHNKMVTEMTNQ